MGNEQNRRPQRQNWIPNVFFASAYGAWRLVFAAVKIAIGAVATVGIILVICALAFAGALGNYLTEDVMPNAGMSLDNINLDQTSFVYYNDENDDIQLLQQIHTVTDRQWASFDEIPEDLIHAAVAIEDKRFYEHQGVDWFTTIKAFANMFMGDDSKGGSTITQQLVKNLTGDDSVTVQRKLMEIFRATQFERTYDKNVVMEWYLNYIYLGNGRYGVRSAAEFYYGKELEMLTTAECASLISITNNPSIYDPYGPEWEWHFNLEDPLQLMSGADRNNVRKAWTLGEMVTQGWITWDEYYAAMDQEIEFKAGIDPEDRLTLCTNANCGYQHIASSFDLIDGVHYCPLCGNQVNTREDKSQEVYSWFVDTVLEDVAKALCEKDGVEWSYTSRAFYMDKIQRSGYHIYSTLDMKVQNQVDEVYENTVIDTRSGQDLSSGMVIIDNDTGYIVAIAGDLGKKTTHDEWNNATDAVLQVGSSIKPLTAYALGFENGDLTPATVIPDMPTEFRGWADNPWPNNWNYEFSVRRSTMYAIRDSVNTCAVRAVIENGIDETFDFAKDQLGLTSMIDYYVNDWGEVESDRNLMALGMGGFNYGVTVREMACAYATFANEGEWREGITFTKVYDSDGNLILEKGQESRQVLSEKTIDYMNYCLANVITQGTGTSALWDGYYGYLYGKTGSTDSYKDLYFCGYTTHYTAAAWSGYETPEPINIVTSGFANPSVTLFRMIMKPLHEDLEPERLYDIDNMPEVSVCLDSGMMATDACKADIRLDYDLTKAFTTINTVRVYREDRPKKSCDLHVVMDICSEGQCVANEWCKLFAGVEGTELKIEQKALTKVTQEQIDELLKVKKHGLWEEFLQDSWVYLINENGTDNNSFKGLDPDKPCNEKINAPYKVCEIHTKEAWEAYQQSIAPPTEPTDPNAPTDPTDPTDQQSLLDQILDGIDDLLN